PAGLFPRGPARGAPLRGPRTPTGPPDGPTDEPQRSAPATQGYIFLRSMDSCMSIRADITYRSVVIIFIFIGLRPFNACRDGTPTGTDSTNPLFILRFPRSHGAPLGNQSCL